MFESPLPVPVASVPLDSARIVLHEYPSLDTWTWASAVAISAELRRDLDQHSRARLLVSGGDTPLPVYHALSKAPLAWDRVDVGLVDERWLLPDDPDSNARLIRAHLLTDHAAEARLEPITLSGRSIEDAVAIASAHGRQGASIAVLGMGEDGHIASLFPHMRDLSRALAHPQPYVAVDASGQEGARSWPRRISLTPSGLARARSRLLLLQGQCKRKTLEQALASGNVEQWPVLAAVDARADSPLHVYWCP